MQVTIEQYCRMSLLLDLQQQGCSHHCTDGNCPYDRRLRDLIKKEQKRIKSK